MDHFDYQIFEARYKLIRQNDKWTEPMEVQTVGALIKIEG
jgi:hypothetical protein